MRLVLNVLRKDLQAFWKPLVLLAAVVAIKLGIGVIAYLDPQAAERSYREFLVTIANLVIGLEVLVTWILVALLVQEDSVAGGPAFWRTRPISRIRLFASKTLGVLALLGGIPVLVSTPWWLFCGLGPWDIVLAAAETVLWQALIATAALGAAAMTRDLKGFLGATLALAVLAPLALSLVFLVRDATFGTRALEQLFETRFEPLALLENGGREYTQLGIVAALIVLGSGLVAARQTLTLSRAGSLSLALILLAAITVTAKYWRWDAMGLLLAPESTTLGRDVRLTLRTAKPDPYTARGDFAVDTRFWIEGIPEGYRLRVRDWSALLRWKDEVVHRQVRPRWLSESYLGIDNRPLLGLPALTPVERTRIVTREKIQTLGEARSGLSEEMLSFWNLESFQPGKRKISFGVAGLGADGLARFRSEAPEFQVTTGLALDRPEIVGTSPLRVGSALVGGAGNATIERFTVGSNGGVEMRVRATRTSTLWQDIHYVSWGAGGSGHWEDEYWLVDSASGRAAIASGSHTEQGVRIATVSLFRSNPRFEDTSRTWPTIAAQPDWWSDLRLVGIRYRAVAAFTRRIAVEKLTLSGLPESLPKPPAPRRRSFSGSIQITGEVRIPGHSIPIDRASVEPLRAIRALRQSGGLLDTADAARAHIIRRNPDGSMILIPFDLPGYFEGRIAETDAPLLEPGDIVHVPPLAP